MQIEAMKVELRDLDAQFEAISAKRQDLRQRIADAQAVFKVGDRVTYEGVRYVWQITRIGVGFGNAPMYIGARLKKNGEPGVATGEIWVPYNAVLRAA